jgi:predicted transcriptional regulator
VVCGGAMKYRGSTEIIASILESIQNGSATRTRIMYHSYLSYSQLKEYLALLEGRQLIRFEDEMNTYKLTEKAIQFMTAYSEIDELVPGVDSKRKTK